MRLSFQFLSRLVSTRLVLVGKRRIDPVVVNSVLADLCRVMVVGRVITKISNNLTEIDPRLLDASLSARVDGPVVVFALLATRTLLITRVVLVMPVERVVKFVVVGCEVSCSLLLCLRFPRLFRIPQHLLILLPKYLLLISAL